MSNTLPVYECARDAASSSHPENDMATPSTRFGSARIGGGNVASPPKLNRSGSFVFFAVTFNLALAPVRAVETVVPPPPIPNTNIVPPTRVGVPFVIPLNMAWHEAHPLTDEADALAREATRLLQEDNTREENGTLLLDFSCPTTIKRFPRFLETFSGLIKDIENEKDYEALQLEAAKTGTTVMFVGKITWCGTREDQVGSPTYKKDIVGCHVPKTATIFIQTSPSPFAKTLAHEVGHLKGILGDHPRHPSRVMSTAETVNPSGVPSSPTEPNIVTREECKIYGKTASP